MRGSVRLLPALALLLASCASIQTPIQVDAVGEEARASLRDLEYELLEARALAESLPRLQAEVSGRTSGAGDREAAAPDPAAAPAPAGAEDLAVARAGLKASLDRAGKTLAALEREGQAASGRGAVQGADASFEAGLAALRGEALLLGADLRGARRALEAALALAPDEELALLLAARLEPEPAARLGSLDAALKIAASSHRLEAERGSVLLGLGRAAEALASFDLALPYLPEPWLRLRGPERELAWARRDEDSAPAPGLAITAEPADFLLLAAILRGRTGLLDALPGALGSDRAALDALRAAGLVPEGARPGDPLDRAGAARALWGLLHRGQAALLARYSTRYAGRRSPVPDLDPSSPAFDAALGLVEAEVMELPDGRNFLSSAPVTGLELDGWARATEALRRSGFQN